MREDELIKKYDVVVLRGLPGSGKTTLRKRLIDQCEDVSRKDPKWFCNDDARITAEGGYLFDPSTVREDHYKIRSKYLDYLMHMRNQAVVGGKDFVVVDACNLHLFESSFYMEAALAMGFKAAVVVVDGDPYECFARNTHKIPVNIFRELVQAAIREDHIPDFWDVYCAEADMETDGSVLRYTFTPLEDED